MKKLFYLLFLAPFCLMTSCKDDDDFAPFDLTLTVSGVTTSGNGFYTVPGEELTLENMKVVGIDGNTTGVSNVVYYLDGAPWPLVPGVENPFTISTDQLPLGKHSIGITGNLLQENYSIKNFAANFSVTVVESTDELPLGAPAIGTYSQTISFSN